MRDAGWDPNDTSEPDPGESPDPAAAPKRGAKAKPKGQERPTEADPGEPKPDDEQEEPKPAAKKTAAEEKADAEKLGARGLLEKLAKEQGFVIEDGKITTKQHAEFRLLKKEQREQLVRAEKEAVDRINAAQTELAERFKRVEAFETAIKNLDHDALAQAGGFESWDKLQADIIARNSDPSFKEVRELKEWKAKQEAEAEQAAQQRLAAERQQAENNARAQYRTELSQRMGASQDPLVAAMHDDPLFVQAIHRIQIENFDGRETVTPEQAVRMSAQGSRITLGEELQALHRRLDKTFGKKPEPEKPPAPKPKIAGGPKAAPSAPAKHANRNERMRAYSDRLGEAVERDRKAGGERY
jgi:hypothetical protein